MKTTGVVRRIDDLGRIVVPKEIRRSLRIRDGESLEIFVDKDVIALKKYSPMNDLEDFSRTLVESVYQSLKSSIFITDRDEILAAAGPMKKKYQGKPISQMLDAIIAEQKQLDGSSRMKLELIDGDLQEGFFQGNTIVVNGDPIGEVFIFNPDGRISDTEVRIVEIIAQFLGKHLEE